MWNVQSGIKAVPKSFGWSHCKDVVATKGGGDGLQMEIWSEYMMLLFYYIEFKIVKPLREDISWKYMQLSLFGELSI